MMTLLLKNGQKGPKTAILAPKHPKSTCLINFFPYFFAEIAIQNYIR
jgi:hypothetical protein